MAEGSTRRTVAASGRPPQLSMMAGLPEAMEQVLADTVLKEFKVRLGRIGLEYQSPVRP